MAVSKLDVLNAMECLIDTVASTTDLENIYDDSKSKSMSWEELWDVYKHVKEEAGVE